jgi:hypothetical protein
LGEKSFGISRHKVRLNVSFSYGWNGILKEQTIYDKGTLNKTWQARNKSTKYLCIKSQDKVQK